MSCCSRLLSYRAASVLAICSQPFFYPQSYIVLPIYFPMKIIVSVGEASDTIYLTDWYCSFLLFRGFLGCNCFVLSKNRIMCNLLIQFCSHSLVTLAQLETSVAILCFFRMSSLGRPRDGNAKQQNTVIDQCNNWWLQCCYYLSSHCCIFCRHGRDDSASRKLSHPSSSSAVLCNIISCCGRCAIPSQ